MTPAWPHGDPRDVVRSIVADPRFRVAPALSGPRRSWLDDVREWLAALLRRVFHGLDHALGARNPFDTAIGFVVIGAAFVLLGYCIYVITRSVMRGAGRGRTVVDARLSPAVQGAAELRAASAAAARAGRYRAAAALLFFAAVRALDERGHVAYDPARTPGEYRRIVRDPSFDAFAADAVIALFAAAEPQADLYARMIGNYERFFGAAA